MMDDVEARIEAALPEATFKAMEHIRTVTTPKVPYETGNLAGSGAVSNTGPTSAQIYYPGPYARYQEYGISKNGKPLRHERGGQSYFLMTTMVQEQENALAVAAKVIRDAIE